MDRMNQERKMKTEQISKNKYKYVQVETTESVILSNGVEVHPVATLATGGGGMCQIVKDDHCYVLLLRQLDGTYTSTTHIFPEAFDVLKTLPNPS